MNSIFHSTDETVAAAREWVKKLAKDSTGASLANNDNKTRSMIIGLNGNLGSGKTTFVQAVAKELGVMEQVTSPTYVIQKSYPVLNHSYSTVFAQLVHIDAYRIDDPKELEILGFEALCADPKKLILIEWPEKISTLLPSSTRHLFFSFIDETTREIEGL